ncbi:MAG: hypothetical protein AVDCRST_MAG90-570 [uncultured Microvirga sp.]|uniref:VCBS repeat-containing protein n=1 Tax=uncultured Microvirga sp. TaxID=412392 RepID=A0A6J4KR83_9HYPH|nr:MAG: hypothetical protein AVDCRST_MAG90-570 [uncultured Microvirga sp.]
MSDERRFWRAGAAAVALAALSGLAQQARAEPSVTLLPLGFEVTEFRGPGSRLATVLSSSDALRGERLAPDQKVIAVWGKTGGAALTLAGRELRTVPLGPSIADAAERETARSAIPGSRLQAAGPLTAYLSDSTEDYRHGVLGDAVEAKAVSIVERQPVAIGPDPKPVPTRTAKVPAGDTAVFEDLEPRLADLDGDGAPEIVVVKSSSERGSSLAVIGRREGAWAIVAETPPIGQPNRWLNPAAIADFDGDGKTDIALVRTPHLDGVLQLWTFDRGRLALRHEAAGYSNHALGSTALDNAAAVDLDGDGRPELVIPTLDRTALAVLSLKGGVKEIRRIALPARVLRGVAALGAGKDAHLLAALEDGRVALVRP